MKVVILGAGRRGIRLARQLSEEKKDIIIIDSSSENVAEAMSKADCIAYQGNGTDIEDLEKAEIRNADAFIALSGSDETNLIACSIASSEFKIPNTICAIKNISYSKSHSLIGITHVINPYKDTAEVINRHIENGIFSDIISFEQSSLVLYNVTIEPGSAYVGRSVKDLRGFIHAEFIIAARQRGSRAEVPSGDTVIHAGDTLSIVAKEESISAILKALGKQRQKPKKTLIVGASKISEFLIREINPSRHKDITLIDQDKEQCKLFSAKYPDILVINEKITREGVFRQEGFENYDLLISLTDNDELNLIIASFAKFKGVKASIAIINKNTDYLAIAEHLNIDTIISSQDASVDAILSYMHERNVSSLHSIFDGTLEAFECKITSESKLTGRLLMNIDMRGKGIVTGVIKPNETIIPGGKYKICDGDTLIMVAERSAYKFIQDLISEN